LFDEVWEELQKQNINLLEQLDNQENEEDYLLCRVTAPLLCTLQANGSRNVIKDELEFDKVFRCYIYYVNQAIRCSELCFEVTSCEK
jgi:hypothetical protein